MQILSLIPWRRSWNIDSLNPTTFRKVFRPRRKFSRGFRRQVSWMACFFRWYRKIIGLRCSFQHAQTLSVVQRWRAWPVTFIHVKRAIIVLGIDLTKMRYWLLMMMRFPNKNQIKCWSRFTESNTIKKLRDGNEAGEERKELHCVPHHYSRQIKLKCLWEKLAMKHVGMPTGPKVKNIQCPYTICSQTLEKSIRWRNVEIPVLVFVQNGRVRHNSLHIARFIKRSFVEFCSQGVSSWVDRVP